MEDGIQNIFICNVFKKHRHAEKYVQMAGKYGYKVFSIICENINDTKNIHDVDQATVSNQKKGFEVKL